MTQPMPPSAGGVHPLFADWPPLSDDEIRRLKLKLDDLAPGDRLAQFREVVTGVGAAEGEDSSGAAAERLVEPPMVDLAGEGRDGTLHDLRDLGLSAALETAVVVAAAGGGTRLAQSVPAAERPALLRAGRMTKPTFPVGPISGKSALCRTLEGLTLLREEAEVDVLPVWVVVSAETRGAVELDLDRNQRTIRLPHLQLLDQREHPTLDLQGRVLTTRDPETGDAALVTSASGTLGVLRTMARPRTSGDGTALSPLDWATDRGKSTLAVLYGDDALLNRADLLLMLLGAAREHDLLLVGVEKDGLRLPPGGTIHCRQRDGDSPRLCITELGDRTAALDEVEQEWHARHGRYFPLNAGPLVLKRDLARRALAEWQAPLHFAERAVTVRGPGSEWREVRAAKVEEFLPEVVAFANSLGATSVVASCARRDYGAIKDYTKARRHSASISRRGRTWLSARGLELDPGAMAEVADEGDLTTIEGGRVAVGLELSGAARLGRGVSLAGTSCLRILGDVHFGEGATLTVDDTLILCNEGSEPLVVGDGAHLRVAAGPVLPHVLVVGGSVPAGVALDASTARLETAAPPPAVTRIAHRYLAALAQEPLLLSYWDGRALRRYFMAPDADVAEILRRSVPPDVTEVLWALRRESEEAFAAVAGELCARGEDAAARGAAVATAELLDTANTDCGEALLDLAADIGGAAERDPEIVRRALGEMTGGVKASPGISTQLAGVVAALATSRCRALVERLGGDERAALTWILRRAREQSLSFAEFAAKPFLPVAELEPDQVRQAMAPAHMVRSFSGVRADYGNGARLSAAHRLIAAADAYAFVELLRERFSGRPFKVVLGSDPRPTSAGLLDAHLRGLLAAASASGQRVEIANLGLVATPAFEESVRELGADGGIMVTASHCPVHQNGSKYTCGTLDASGEPHPLAGALLPAPDMAELMRRAQALIDGVCAGDRGLLSSLNAVDEVAVSEAATVHPLCREQAWSAFRGFLRKQLGLTDENDFVAFREAVQGAELVLDPNGGTACGAGSVILRNFGFQVHEINGESGEPRHTIEPSEAAFEDLIPTMRSTGASVGGVMDWDADRLTWAAHDRYGGISSAGPQEVAAFNVAMWLTWLDLRGELEHRRVAVVAHGPTSGAVDDIAACFGAHVFRVETGEMNLVARMAELRTDGWLAALGIEGANGGTIFGEDTCRNGFLTLLVAGMVAANSTLVRHWLEKSGRWDCLSDERRAHFAEGKYTLDEVIASLPQYATAEAKAASARVLSGPAWQGILKDRFFERFEAEVWHRPAAERRRLCGLTADREYVSHRQTNYEESREVDQRTGDHSGGYKIELTDAAGDRSFIWLRFSRTEPSQCRIITDSKHEQEQRALAARALELFDRAMADAAAE